MDEEFENADDFGFVIPGDGTVEEEGPAKPIEGPDRELAMDLLFNRSHYKTFEVFGHDVTLRTLTTHDELQVGLLVAEYEDKAAFTKAYKTAMVAAALEEIDSNRVWMSIDGEQREREVYHKFQKIKKYNPLFIDEVYKKFLELESELEPLLERLKKG